MTDNVTKIDNGAETVTIDETKLDNRSVMLASASHIAGIVINAEATLADSAKAWGTAIFNAVYVDKASTLDALIGDSKVAAGWPSLTTSDAGKKAKGRLEVYFTNARTVAENWLSFDDAKRAAILDGTSSIHYIATQIGKAKRDAKREAEKAAKALADDAAKALADAATPATDETDTVSIDIVDAMETIALTLPDMADADFLALADAFNAMVAAYDARLAAMADAHIEAQAA